MREAFDLTSLYQQAFGFVGKPFPGINTNRAGVQLAEGFNTSVVPSDSPPVTVAPYGIESPVFMPVTLNGYRLPNEPLVDVSISKAIVKTQVAGYNGTIKENMGLEDYSITIKGLAINQEEDEYPESIIRQLRHLFEKTESVTILSPITQLLSIDQVVIESFSLSSLEGFRHVQPYEFRCSSDQSIELLIKEKEQEEQQR